MEEDFGELAPAGDEQLKASAIRLGEVLGEEPWFCGVGLSLEYGRPVFIIYVSSEPERERVPTQWDFVSVRTECLGKLARRHSEKDPPLSND